MTQFNHIDKQVKSLPTQIEEIESVPTVTIPKEDYVRNYAFLFKMARKFGLYITDANEIIDELEKIFHIEEEK